MCLIEFWYIIKSSNKSDQIPLQPTIQHSWAPQANYDEVIISAEGSTLEGSFWNTEYFQLGCSQPWGRETYPMCLLYDILQTADSGSVIKASVCAKLTHFTTGHYSKQTKQLNMNVFFCVMNIKLKCILLEMMRCVIARQLYCGWHWFLSIVPGCVGRCCYIDLTWI